MVRVLVTCGEQRAALAVVRSLGRAGHSVLVGSHRGHSLAGASRYAKTDLALGDPLTASEAYAARVGEVIAEESVDIVLPITEAALLSTLSHRSAYAPARLPFPEKKTFQLASDKAWLTESAIRLGIPVPTQVVIDKSGSIPPLFDSERGYVLKPSRSVRGGSMLGVSYVPSPSQLQEVLEKLPAEAFPLLIQNRIVGAGEGVFLLRWNGVTRATFAHRRIREKPPSGGVSVLRKSVPLEPDVRGFGESLLDLLDWEGVAMIEFKRDAETGSPFLMELNGRFWGSLQLAIDAGVDFPRLLVDCCTGSSSPPTTYRPGVRTRWLMGDLDHLLLRLTRPSKALHLAHDAPGRLATLAQFIGGFFPPTRQEVLKASDPRPFLREVTAWVDSLRKSRGW